MLRMYARTLRTNATHAVHARMLWHQYRRIILVVGDHEAVNLVARERLADAAAPDVPAALCVTLKLVEILLQAPASAAEIQS